MSQISYLTVLEMKKMCSGIYRCDSFPVVWYLSLWKYILTDSKITSGKVLGNLKTENFHKQRTNSVTA